MRQKFKGSTLYTKRVVDNLDKYYKASLSGKSFLSGINWYLSQHIYLRGIAKKFDLPLIQVCAVCAILSPQTSWTINKRFLEAELSGNRKQNNKLIVSKIEAAMQTTCKDELIAIISSDKSLKTRNFFMNLYEPTTLSGVTVDRHAIAACIQPIDNTYALDEKKAQITAGQYRFFERCYGYLAQRYSILPHQAQAIIWETYREVRGLTI